MDVATNCPHTSPPSITERLLAGAMRWGRWPLVLIAGLFIGLSAHAQSTTFTVTVVDKSSDHPNPGGTIGEAYAIDGVEGAVLRLERGQTYTFQMDGVASIHPFYLSTGPRGGGAEVFEEGVDGNFVTGNGTLTLTVDDATPGVLYYQCGSHLFMGWRIYVTEPGPAPVELELMAEGLTSPVELVEVPDGTGRLAVVDQVGQVRLIGAGGKLMDTPFLDVSDRIVALSGSFDERGLLSVAFHPNYAENGRLFVYYSAPLRSEAPADFNHTSRLSSFTVSDDPDLADASSEVVLLEVDQPQGNHNAGKLAFGPDGYLYVGLGDGGGANDTALGHVEDWYAANDGGNGQDITSNRLGSILRLDVDGGDPYAIPPDNPFVEGDGLDEIYAYGFRNPWRFSFDEEHGLLVGDAGQRLWEEVSVVTAGGNYGWNVREGTHCFSTDMNTTAPATCPEAVEGDHPDAGAELVGPVIEYGHPGQTGLVGLVVVGGHVYRGDRLPELAGRYIFADWSASFSGPDGQLFVATPGDASGLWPFEALPVASTADGRLDHFVLGFGRDASGEVYVLTSDNTGPTGTTGRVYQLGADQSTAVEEQPTDRPVSLSPAYPNPFGSETRLQLELSRTAEVALHVYDLLGRRVATLLEGPHGPGTTTAVWRGRSATGRPLASGAYLIVVETEEHRVVRQVMLVR